MRDPIHTREYQAMRAKLRDGWERRNAACVICGQATIDWRGPANQPDSFELQHVISRNEAKRSGRFHLIMDPANCAPSHTRCNRSAGDRAPRPSIGETSEDY